ncbi:MAG: acyltransferase [Nitrospirae bacterium]|nr:acyltransferase [Nitrospirota bacterium]
MGTGVVIASHVTLRIPSRVRLGNHVLIDEGCTLDVKDSGAAGIAIGDDCVLHKGAMLTTGSGGQGQIIFGKHVSLGPYSQIMGHGVGVEIGEDTEIAGGVIMVSSNHTFEDPSVPIRFRPSVSRGIKIGRNVWIEADVKILDGVTVGDGAVIGAGAVVTADIPSRCIAVGVPARVIKEIGKA